MLEMGVGFSIVTSLLNIIIKTATLVFRCTRRAKNPVEGNATEEPTASRIGASADRSSDLQL